MVHRSNTNVTDTLENHSDVRNKTNNFEKATTTSIDMLPTQDEKNENFSNTDDEEEVKNPSKFSLFYQRHTRWFQ